MSHCSFVKVRMTNLVDDIKSNTVLQILSDGGNNTGLDYEGIVLQFKNKKKGEIMTIDRSRS